MSTMPYHPATVSDNAEVDRVPTGNAAAGAANVRHDANDQNDEFCTTDQVLDRMEALVAALVQALDVSQLPVLTNMFHTNDNSQQDDDDDDDNADNDEAVTSPSQRNPRGGRGKPTTLRKDFSLQQARSLTSIVLVLEYCHSLLLEHKTTTVREVYYAHVTHFRNQAECDLAIRDAAVLLHVPRYALGLQASAKGWFCGDVQIVHTTAATTTNTTTRLSSTTLQPQPQHGATIPNDNDDDNAPGQPQVLLDGRQLFHTVNGSIIGSEWLEPRRNFTVTTQAAHCILVIEKEGIYRRLAQDRFFDTWPCILVTGKGFPDLSTRAFVHVLHHTLNLPVWGLSDGNPFGALILQTYNKGSDTRGVDGGHRFSVPIQWIGLRASQMEHFLTSTALPSNVVQLLTALDLQRLNGSLLHGVQGWVDTPDAHINAKRTRELQNLRDNGRKMELEALHWLGVDYLGQWLSQIFTYNLTPGVNDNDDEKEEIPHLQII